MVEENEIKNQKGQKSAETMFNLSDISAIEAAIDAMPSSNSQTGAAAAGISLTSEEKASKKETFFKRGFLGFGAKKMPPEEQKKMLEEKKKKEQEEKEIEEARKRYEAGIAKIRDLIAPASIKIAPNYIMINDQYIRTLFVFTYPRFIYANWLSPIINIDATIDISMFIYPQETRAVLEALRRRAGQVQSAIALEQEKGMVRSPELETAIEDIEELRDRLQRGEEKLFHFALYLTLYAKTLEELDRLTNRVEAILGGTLIYTKVAMFQAEQGFKSTLPLARDLIEVKRNLNTGALSTVFPFTSMELTSNEGILYGINRHNNGLIIFDRFKMENANMVVFAKSGAGKSYTIKLEALRYLMWGVDVIVIDPENEYQNLCSVVGGSYFSLSLGSDTRINPFDLPRLPAEASEAEGEDNLRATITTLHGLMNLMLGKLSPEEDAIMDRALIEAFALRDITSDPKTQTNPPPVMEDLYNILLNMKGAESLAARLQKYVSGTFAGIFNKPTNVNLEKGFVVFNIRDLEESLRPIGMFLIMNFIWTKIRMERRQRLLIVDEAWLMMIYEDAAKFLYSIAKRCRKYFLGLTTITQDVEDFLGSKYGKAIVSNSSIQLLMKQSPASIDIVAETFNLTEGEKFLLLESEVGEGLFFAGVNHVAIKVYASPNEDQIITTSSKQLAEVEAAKRALGE